jgi:MoxR-vWA-beta-propeller ternary system domain bpX5
MIKPNWQLRDQALEPAAAIAYLPETIAALRDWSHTLNAEQKLLIRQWHWPGFSVVAIRERALLPWNDGLAFAGVCASAPRLWLPTHLHPGVNLELLSRAVLRKTGGHEAIIWHQPAFIADLS